MPPPERISNVSCSQHVFHHVLQSTPFFHILSRLATLISLIINVAFLENGAYPLYNPATLPLLQPASIHSLNTPFFILSSCQRPPPFIVTRDFSLSLLSLPPLPREPHALFPHALTRVQSHLRSVLHPACLSAFRPRGSVLVPPPNQFPTFYRLHPPHLLPVARRALRSRS